ncbi:aminotransferase class IV [Sphingobacterium sp. UT-1RO-CII-1]|uniref:aminotransferase class IV n=1 Tax=Sphingobacterium sp. UT-1RO-CII-1 TaxID=2995225 RepID=UPI00227B4ACF|nr:aminotransferase class IV [Sphingobacterium sp. UT-1RO-CII-1]MCY4779706.1 aminotransferase class IV [Sphingobacterium sp. UT-1RO-CII-1]
MGYVIFNGRLIAENQAQLFINDLAIVRGYGVFDFFKTVNGKALFIEDNLDRFYQSASFMNLPVVYSREEVKQLISQLMVVNNMPESGIKMLLTGGYSADGYSIAEPNFIISQQSIKRNMIEEQQGLKLMMYDYQRPFSRVKTIDYVMGIQAMKLARSKGADDVLFSKDGRISECPRANFFLVNSEGVLITAEEGVLEGVTRKKILEVAKENDLKVEQRAVGLKDLKYASEAFITSTTKNITPITNILGFKNFGDGAGQITKRLQDLWQELIYEK